MFGYPLPGPVIGDDYSKWTLEYYNSIVRWVESLTSHVDGAQFSLAGSVAKTKFKRYRRICLQSGELSTTAAPAEPWGNDVAVRRFLLERPGNLLRIFGRGTNNPANGVLLRVSRYSIGAGAFVNIQDFQATRFFSLSFAGVTGTAINIADTLYYQVELITPMRSCFYTILYSEDI